MALGGPEAPHTPPVPAQEADQRLHQRRRAALEAPRRADARQVPHEQPEIDAADLQEFGVGAQPVERELASSGAAAEAVLHHDCPCAVGQLQIVRRLDEPYLSADGGQDSPGGYETGSSMSRQLAEVSPTP